MQEPDIPIDRDDLLFQQLFELAPDATLLVADDGRIRRANSQAERMFGYLREQLIGQSVDLLLPVGVKSRHAGHQRAYFADPRIRAMGAGLDLRARRHDGTEFQVDIMLSPFETPDGKCVLCAIRDVTNQNGIEARLRETSQLELIGRLAGGLAHEFNNLFTAINGNIELVLDSEAVPASEREMLTQARQAGTRAAQLTRQLLAFGRRQILQPRTIDLNQLVKELTAMLARVVGDEIELATSLSDQPVYVRADPIQVEQMLIELVANARDAMPSGGRALIATGTIDAGKSTHGIDLEPGRYGTMSVRDAGSNLTPEARAHIFEPFSSLVERVRGRGLGLAAIHGVAKQSGGGVRVAGHPGTGETFTVYLPLAHRPVADSASVILTGDSVVQDSGSSTILVAEDDAAVRGLMASALRQKGYQVREAEDGEAALVLFQQRGTEIALVVTDVMMPTRTGPSLVDELRQRQPTLPVLYVSGYAPDGLGLDEQTEFLAKPFQPGTLIDAVQQLLVGPKRR